MTWTKLGDEFSDDLARVGVSDAAYRTHAEAIGWLYRIEDTKLRIPKHLVRRFAGSVDHEVAIKELVAAGLWRDRGDSWEVSHHADVIRQSLQQQRASRDRNKQAQRNFRRKKAHETGPDVSTDVSAYVSTDVSPHTDRQTDIPTGADRREEDTQ